MTDQNIIKHRASLFFGSFAQVTFVAMNVNFISKGLVIPMVLSSFIVSFIWTLNVKRITIGDMRDRAWYAAGAMLGTFIGFYTSHWISRYL